MELGLGGRAALVTAGTKGLGRGAAYALAREGANVLICGRNEQRLDAAIDAAPAGGGRVEGVVADVTDLSEPVRLVEETVARFGSIDVLVANAGGPPKARALEVDDAGLLAALNANLQTSIRLALAAVPHMRAAGWGRICFITSNAVKQPIPDLAYSNVARTGLWAWAKTAAADLIGDGITVNLVCPGLHETDRVKELGHTGRLGDPEDFGRVVAFLCSAPAGYVSGTALPVDGAATLGLL
ncbi:MAG: SDR family oxidoreductase [Actinomycetota bacterium]